MVIKKFSKLKDGMYKVLLEDSSFEIHEELILKYELLMKKEISIEQINQLEKENVQYKAYNIALKELKKRLRSTKELKEILKKNEVDNKIIEKVIEQLKQQGYLDDNIYTDSYIHDRILLSSDGPLKIKKDLQVKGILPNTIEEKIKQFTPQMEEERMNKIIQKQLKQNRKSIYEFRLKMQQFFNHLGYHSEVVQLILENISYDEKKIYEMEYQKIYRRLAKKYQGKELENRIRQKLYQKGFKI